MPKHNYEDGYTKDELFGALNELEGNSEKAVVLIAEVIENINSELQLRKSISGASKTQIVELETRIAKLNQVIQLIS